MSIAMAALVGMGCFALGALSWTFLEYALHHWVGHIGKGKNLFSREHLQHHYKKDYFAPWWKKIVAATIVLGSLAFAWSYLVGGIVATSYMLGIGLGYMGYEWLHRRAHTHAPLNGYGRWARKHHFYHHLVSAKYNHGVTTPIWDMVFGTYIKPGQIKVPPKLEMRWLCDPTTQDVRPEFAQDYKISR